jgi:hypothetical protein
VSAWIAYAIGVATLPALWLLWHIAAILVFTLRDTWRLVRGEVAELWMVGEKALAFVAVILGPFIYFAQRLLAQIEARLDGYATEVTYQR